MVRRKKILCVFFPSPAVGELTKLLKGADFTVFTAHSFRSALQGLHTESPDAVLLDKRFAYLDGLPSADIIKGTVPGAGVMLVSLHDANFPDLIRLLKEKFSPQANEAGSPGS